VKYVEPFQSLLAKRHGLGTVQRVGGNVDKIYDVPSGPVAPPKSTTSFLEADEVAVSQSYDDVPQAVISRIDLPPIPVENTRLSRKPAFLDLWKTSSRTISRVSFPASPHKIVSRASKPKVRRGCTTCKVSWPDSIFRVSLRTSTLL
jgi:hypothetical protein